MVLLDGLRNDIDLVVVPGQGNAGRAVLTGNNNSVHQVWRDGFFAQRNRKHASGTAHLLGDESADVTADDGLLQGQSTACIGRRHLAA